MRYLKCFARARFVAALLALLCIAGFGVSTRRTQAIQTDPYTQSREDFKAAVRDGIGSEVLFAGPGDDVKNVRASVESAAQFMRKRSGVDLRGQTKTRLADMEASALAGTTRRITLDELSDIIATTAIERVSAATDDEIGRAAETLRGFDAPDLPDSFRRGRSQVQLRGNRWGVDGTPEQFVAQVKAIRDAAPIVKDWIVKPAAKQMAARDLQRRMKYLSESVPESFGGSTASITPLQAVLLAYSTISDDPLTFSDAGLQKRMEFRQTVGSKHTGQPYPSPAGHHAYGLCLQTICRIVLYGQARDFIGKMTLHWCAT